MTTMEHLFMQIFDRKKWIEDQLKQQVESYSQSLAYNLLAAGLKPPAWLLDDGSEALGRSDKKEFSREQIVSEIIFRPQSTATPSANCHNLCSLPTLKSTTTCQLNAVSSQLCAPNEHLRSEHSGLLNTQHEDGILDAVGLEFVESSVQVDPLATIQRSRSRQRDLENRFTGNEIAANIGGENDIEQYTGRVTRSRVASLNPNFCLDLSSARNSLVAHSRDGDKDSSSRLDSQALVNLDSKSNPERTSKSTIVQYTGRMTRSRSASLNPNICQQSSHIKNSLVPHSRYGDKVSPSRLDSQTLAYCDKISKPVRMSNSTISDVQEAKGKPTASEPAVLLYDDNLAVDDNANTLADGCSIRTVPNKLASDGSNFVSSELSLTCSAVAGPSQTHSLAKILPFDGMESCCLKIPYDACSEKERHSCSLENRDTKLMAEQPVKEDSTLGDSAHGSLGIRQLQEDVWNTEVSITFEEAHVVSDKERLEQNANDTAALECQPRSRSSATTDSSLDNLRSWCSNLCYSNNSTEVLESLVASHSRDAANFLREEMSNVAEMDNKLLEGGYSPRRSHIICKEDVCVSSSPKSIILLENNKEDSFQISEKLNEKQTWHAAEPNSTTSQNAPSESGYFLRSSSSHGKSLPSSVVNASSLKRPLPIITHAPEVSGPKRRKMTYHLDGILSTSPRVRPVRISQLMSNKESTHSISKTSSASVAKEHIQPSSYQTGTNRGIENADPASNFKVIQQSKKQCLLEDNSFLRSPDQIKLPAECTLGMPSCCLVNKTKANKSTFFRPEEYGVSGDYPDPSFFSSESDNLASKTFCYDMQTMNMIDDVNNSYTNNASKPPNHDDNQMACNDITPEFEGFSIEVPPIIEERIFYNSGCPNHARERVSWLEQLGSSMNLATPKSGPPGKYKINKLPDVLQSLPTGLMEHMSSTGSFQFDGDSRKNLLRSEDASYCSLKSASVGRSSFDSMPSSGARFGWEAIKAPLTPLVEKLSLRMVSGKSGGSAGTVGSNPELVCFRIDEDTCTGEENEYGDELGASGERASSRGIRMPINRKAILDVTNLYDNVSNVSPITNKILERSCLQPMDSKSYCEAQMSTQFSLGTSCTSKQNQREDKENRYHGGKKERKAAQSLHKRCSKPNLSEKAVERNRSSATIGNGCKPNNIISNVPSFLPLIRKKQQETIIKDKKKVIVKALEAAQTAKLLAEKKQNEREKRKEAVKLERLRVEEKKQLKQKQIEESKKKEADVDRKRQREEEKRKKETKRRCIEESRKLQKQQEDRLNAEKGERELRHNPIDEDMQKKGLEEEAKNHIKPMINGEVVSIAKAAEVEQNTAKGIISTKSLKGVIQDRMSTTEENQDFQSYEMSPYRDSSDEEDGDDESIRAKKYIPLWARKEHLEKNLLLKQHLDPTEIFCRKNSFDLSEVLCPRVSRRPL